MAAKRFRASKAILYASVWATVPDNVIIYDLKEHGCSQTAFTRCSLKINAARMTYTSACRRSCLSHVAGRLQHRSEGTETNPGRVSTLLASHHRVTRALFLAFHSICLVCIGIAESHIRIRHLTLYKIYTRFGFCLLQ